MAKKFWESEIKELCLKFRFVRSILVAVKAYMEKTGSSIDDVIEMMDGSAKMMEEWIDGGD